MCRLIHADVLIGTNVKATRGTALGSRKKSTHAVFFHPRVRPERDALVRRATSAVGVTALGAARTAEVGTAFGAVTGSLRRRSRDRRPAAGRARACLLYTSPSPRD